MRNLVANTLLFVLSLVILTVLLELTVRAYSALFFPKMMVLDQELGWRHARNMEKIFVNELSEAVLVRQNSHGHRGADRSLGKDPGTHRILVLGDSFTEAVQVQEGALFTSLLEERDERLDVVNAGVAGYGTLQQYLYLSSEGLLFEPDTVLLMFYKNDLKDNCLSYSPGYGPRPYAMRHDGSIDVVEELDWTEFSKLSLPMPFASTLNRHSYLYNFLNTRLYQRIFSERVGAIALEDNTRVNACGKRKIFFDIVRRMRDQVRDSGADFFVVLIPTVLEAERGTYELHGELLEFCAASNLRCLSLVDSLHSAISAGHQPYFEKDIHWTAEGHAIAAEQIGQMLFPSAERQATSAGAER